MDDLIIRTIQPEDNAQIAAIIRKIFEDLGVPKEGTAYTDKNLDSLFEYYQLPGASYYVVVQNTSILGGGGIAALRGGPEKVCELQKMYFTEQLRGKGMGKKMLEICLEKAKSFGYTQCYLETMPYMEVARALYEKFGFVYLDGPLGDTGHNSCHIWMLKDLYVNS